MPNKPEPRPPQPRPKHARRHKRCAYHEAGHAVASLAQGYAFKRVFLADFLHDRVPGKRLLGAFVRHGDAPDASPMCEIVISLAGPYAEARYRRCSLSRVYVEQAAGDITDAEDWAARLEELSGEPAEEWLVRGWRHTATLVREHWRLIELTAAALVQRDLTYSDFLRVIIADGLVRLVMPDRHRHPGRSQNPSPRD